MMNTLRPAPEQNPLQRLAAMGRKGDDRIAHLSTGDAILPVERIRNDKTAQLLLAGLYRHIGADPARFIVGTEQNRVNPKTGLAEFMEGGEGGGGSGGGDSAGGAAGGDSAGGASGGGGGAPQGSTGGSMGSEAGGPGVGGPGSGAPGSAEGAAAAAGGQPAGVGGAIAGGAHGMGVGAGDAAGAGNSNPGAAVGDQGSDTSIGNVLSNKFQSMLTQVQNNPIATVLNGLFGMVPIAGQVNTAIGVANMFGANLPTFGSAMTGLGQQVGQAITGPNDPGVTAGAPTPGIMNGNRNALALGGFDPSRITPF